MCTSENSSRISLDNYKNGSYNSYGTYFVPMMRLPVKELFSFSTGWDVEWGEGSRVSFGVLEAAPNAGASAVS